MRNLSIWISDGERVLDRGKIVRSDFISGNEFWSKGGIEVNGRLVHYDDKIV